MKPKDEHTRQELDPATVAPQDESAVPPEGSSQRKAQDPAIQKQLGEMITAVSGVNESVYEHRLVRDLMTAALKLIPDGRDTGELKLISAAVKELRYAYRVFGQYPSTRKVTIFGSARTPADHPDYAAAVEFSRLMAQRQWMAITGAGDGIMKAGHEGPGREASFGVAIRLPFETSANTVIAGDEKLINFRYFFTRKLMFLSQCDAVAVYPGGFGTMDEVYEVLTLVQTGKSSMIPIVLLEGEGVRYWDEWHEFVTEKLLGHKMINDEDRSLYRVCRTAQEGVEEIERFYRVYHSSRYVRDDLVIRMNYAIRDEDVAKLNEEFGMLVKSGQIVQCGPYPEETDHLDMPRLAFTHTRYHYALVRRLIDRINLCEPRAE
ncbi:MAG: LOG family protein [Phycisphaerales bacterium]|nr:LOG family protein [Phycisphaerales bacterium]MCB9837640.1 LOG family protein [Phycisphaera sp.]